MIFKGYRSNKKNVGAGSKKISAFFLGGVLQGGRPRGERFDSIWWMAEM